MLDNLASGELASRAQIKEVRVERHIKELLDDLNARASVSDAKRLKDYNVYFRGSGFKQGMSTADKKLNILLKHIQQEPEPIRVFYTRPSLTINNENFRKALSDHLLLKYS